MLPNPDPQEVSPQCEVQSIENGVELVMRLGRAVIVWHMKLTADMTALPKQTINPRSVLVQRVRRVV
jgi:hypothetical protein